MIFPENRRPPSDHVGGQAFSGSRVVGAMPNSIVANCDGGAAARRTLEMPSLEAPLLEAPLLEAPWEAVRSRPRPDCQRGSGTAKSLDGWGRRLDNRAAFIAANY
jgi:hypothetical protein